MPNRMLLVIENSDEDMAILERILKSIGFRGPILQMANAEKALVALQSHEVSPAVILLDLNLAGLDGRGFLLRIKQDHALKGLPVVILSSSANPIDVDFCYRNGAASYVLKVMDLSQQTEILKSFIDHWFHAAVLPSNAGRAR